MFTKLSSPPPSRIRPGWFYVSIIRHPQNVVSQGSWMLIHVKTVVAIDSLASGGTLIFSEAFQIQAVEPAHVVLAKMDNATEALSLETTRTVEGDVGGTRTAVSAGIAELSTPLCDVCFDTQKAAQGRLVVCHPDHHGTGAPVLLMGGRPVARASNE